MSSLIVPNREDVASAVVAVGFAMAFKGQGSPYDHGIEQFGSVILARNSADRVDSTDRTKPAEATVKEYDMYTAAIRAGYSGYK